MIPCCYMCLSSDISICALRQPGCRNVEIRPIQDILANAKNKTEIKAFFFLIELLLPLGLINLHGISSNSSFLKFNAFAFTEGFLTF